MSISLVLFVKDNKINWSITTEPPHWGVVNICKAEFEGESLKVNRLKGWLDSVKTFIQKEFNDDVYLNRIYYLPNSDYIDVVKNWSRRKKVSCRRLNLEPKKLNRAYYEIDLTKNELHVIGLAEQLVEQLVEKER